MLPTQSDIYYYHDSCNSREWSEIMHIFEISHFRKQPYSRKTMHLESINIAVMTLCLSKIKWKVEYFELPKGEE